MAGSPRVDPVDFSRPWQLSDSILIPSDQKTKKLHVSKAVLAAFSSYFHTLYFGKFPEAEKKEIEVDCQYETLLEILNIIHSIDRKFTTTSQTGPPRYAVAMLIELYKAAQMFGMPVIEELYRQHFDASTAKDQFELVIRLKLPDPERRVVFENIPYSDFKEIVESKKFPFHLSLEEYDIILAKQTECVKCKRRGYFR